MVSVLKRPYIDGDNVPFPQHPVPGDAVDDLVIHGNAHACREEPLVGFYAQRGLLRPVRSDDTKEGTTQAILGFAHAAPRHAAEDFLLGNLNRNDGVELDAGFFQGLRLGNGAGYAVQDIAVNQMLMRQYKGFLD